MSSFFGGLTSACDLAPANSADNDIEKEILEPEVEDIGAIRKSLAPLTPCYWFPIDTAERLLIGAYPRSREQLAALIQRQDVRCFFNLTSDRCYEAWLAPAHIGAVQFLYRPMLRREKVSEDGKVLNACREIFRWLDQHPVEERIYVHSELGYGRAAIVAAILVGGMRDLQTNAAVSLIDRRRAAFRTDYGAEKIVPTVETNAQMQQIFRLLGNPPRFAEEDGLGVRSFKKDEKANGEPKNSGEDAAVGESGDQEDQPTGFAPLHSDVAATSSVTSAATSSGSKKVVGEKLDGVDLLPLPDRSDQSWRAEADTWIKSRKSARRASTAVTARRVPKKTDGSTATATDVVASGDVSSTSEQ